MRPRDTPEYRRQRAEECLAKAEAASTEKERAQWLDVANLWLTKPDEIASDDG